MEVAIKTIYISCPYIHSILLRPILHMLDSADLTLCKFLHLLGLETGNFLLEKQETAAAEPRTWVHAKSIFLAQTFSSFSGSPETVNISLELFISK